MQRSATLRVLASAFASGLAGCGDPVSCVAIPQATGSPSTPTDLQVLSVLPPGVQVHTTETCLPSIEDQGGFLQQTWFIHRTLGLPTMIWCELRDGDAGHGGEYTLPYGLVTTDYSLKPVYYAAKSLTGTAPGFRPQRRV